MLSAQLFLLVSISVANADIIVDSSVQNLTSAVQVDCGGKVCQNFATCNAGNTCECKRGTKGDTCEVVDGCEKLKEKCDKMSSECIYDPDLERGVCKCHNETEKFNGESCVECECGEFGTRCVIIDVDKYCFCKKGYSNDDGKCSPCDCGEFEKGCDFGAIPGKKFCDCQDGYSQNSGICAPCSCGEFQKKCFFDEDKGNKICMCKNGYSDKSGICTPCTCGEFEMKCSFDQEKGNRICICKHGYSDKSGICALCDCGENSTSCTFVKGDKNCACFGGNVDRHGICTNCECGPDELCKFTSSGDKKCDCVGPFCRTQWFRHPAFLVFIVLLCSGVIFGASFVAYRKIRSNRSVY